MAVGPLVDDGPVSIGSEPNLPPTDTNSNTESSAVSLETRLAEKEQVSKAVLPFTKKLTGPVLTTPKSKKVLVSADASAPKISSRRSTRLAN